jgi:hypothetical protein
MTDNPGEPLWSDAVIVARYKAAFDDYPDVHHMALMRWMRDEYEAALKAQVPVEIQEAIGQLLQAVRRKKGGTSIKWFAVSHWLDSVASVGGDSV